MKAFVVCSWIEAEPEAELAVDAAILAPDEKAAIALAADMGFPCGPSDFYFLKERPLFQA